MKKNLFKPLCLLVSLLFINNLSSLGNPITIEQAKQNALSMLQSSDGPRHVRGNVKLKLAHSINLPVKGLPNNSPQVYAFNVGDNDGFVIVSGDDIAEPILGYTEEGRFIADSIPENMKSWLEGYAMEIAWAQKNKIKTTNRVPKTAVTYSNVSPLIESHWNQGAPYNNKCIFNNTRCVTGCTPTAMAQILAYWAIKGVGGKTHKGGCLALSKYTTKAHGYKVPALAKVKFDWNNMKTYKTNTSAQKNAVAQLMRYCGQSLKADYGEDETGAYLIDIMQALQIYFNYNQSMVYIKNNSKEGLNDRLYKEAVFAELKAKRPVLMVGYDKSGSKGHSFICDGYRVSDNKFHFNWGWGGHSDGYYRLYAIENLSKGFNYNYQKCAIIGINPVDARRAYMQVSKDKKTATFYYDTKLGTRDGSASRIWPLDLNPNMTERGRGVTKVVFSKSFANARPLTTEKWFCGFTKLATITGIANLNTSEVTNMAQMFANCLVLKSLDLSKFNTAKVTDMNYMFQNCKSLTTLNITSFRTPKVEYMQSMFNNCEKLTSLNVSKFNTANVKAMANMFDGCKSLTKLDLSNFNTANVGYMSSMFNNCEKLSSLNVSKFNTAKVSMMSNMFNGCKSLSTLNVTSFNTAKVINMKCMFKNCEKLTALNVSKFNTAKVNNMSEMFSGCKSLSKLNISNFKTTNVKNMNSMFMECGITSIKLPSKLKTIYQFMFESCSKLTSIVIPASVTSIKDYAFNNTSKLTSVTVGFSKPVKITSTTFSNRKNCTLHVPKGSRKYFIKAAYWKQFKAIVEASGSNANENNMEMENSTDDLKEITTEKETQFTIYSINGQFLGKRNTTTGLPAGLYIINGKKVVIR